MASFPTKDTVGSLLKKAQHAFRTRLDADLRPLGLTAPQYVALAAIAIEPGASNAHLARTAFVTPQTMQGILAVLERDKLINRTPHPQHGRVLESTITTKGEGLLKQARSRVEALDGLIHSATEGASDEFSRLLIQVADRLAGK